MNKILSRIAFLTVKQVGILAVAVGAAYWYLFFDDGSSLMPQIQALQAQLAEQEGLKGQTESALKKRDHLQETLADLTQKYEELSRQIPTEMSSSDFNRQLDQLRKSSRVNQVSRKPGDTLRGPILEELPVEMKLIGGYSDLAQFVYQASITEKVMLIKRIKIEAISPYDGRLNFDVNLSAYKLATPGQVKGNQEQ